MKNKVLAIGLVILSPVIYYYLTFIFTMKIALPIIYTVTSKSMTIIAIIYMVINTICAILTAFITALPCSYLLATKTKYILVLLPIAILSFPLCAFLMQSNFDRFTLILFIWQCVSVFISVYYFSKIGCRAAQCGTK